MITRNRYTQIDTDIAEPQVSSQEMQVLTSGRVPQEALTLSVVASPRSNSEATPTIRTSQMLVAQRARRLQVKQSLPIARRRAWSLVQTMPWDSGELLALGMLRR